MFTNSDHNPLSHFHEEGTLSIGPTSLEEALKLEAELWKAVRNVESPLLVGTDEFGEVGHCALLHQIRLNLTIAACRLLAAIVRL